MRAIWRGVAVGVVGALSMAAHGQKGAGESSSLLAQAPPRADGTVRLATYNILNLFDDIDDPSLSGKYNDDCYSYDKTVRAKPEHELEAVAKAIRELDADVIGLQEIEGIGALSEFNAKYLHNMGYRYVMSIDVLHERGIEQAVLSRFPIKEAMVWPHMKLEGIHPSKVGSYRIRHAGQEIGFSRSPLFVRIEVPAGLHEKQEEPYEFAMFIVHHKSGRSYGYWRDQESQGVIGKIQALQEAEPELNIAVLGDFNAQPDADSINAYLSSGMRDMATPSGDHADFYTHESRRTIDYIMMNPAMAADVQQEGFVLLTPLRRKDQDYRTTPAPEGFASDHLPVAIDFEPFDR